MQNTKEFLLSNETRKAYLQSTPDKSNLQAEIEKGSSYRELEGNSLSKEKNSVYGTVNILITFNYRNVKWKLEVSTSS